MGVSRRDFIFNVGALALAPLPCETRADHAPAPGAASAQGCGETTSLFIPRDRGFLGRLTIDERTLTLRAAALVSGASQALSQGYLASVEGRDYVNPTLVVRSGQRVKIDFVNAIGETTIVHWHGLSIDTRNDGAGSLLAGPGEHFAYDFPVRNRGALYWYHPHPHGFTAGQAYRGLFGLLEVTDIDEERLRTALDLAPSSTELPLVLQDRRIGSDYAASDADRMHGFLGERALVNGTACAQLDVGTRIYRFRVLNASNARSYLLGWRTADGKPFPFTLIGNDGGLLPIPLGCSAAYLASAERLDMLVDLTDFGVGDTLVLETKSFDPMHMETGADPAPAQPIDHAAMGHAMPQTDGASSAGPTDHAAMDHGAPAAPDPAPPAPRAPARATRPPPCPAGRQP